MPSNPVRIPIPAGSQGNINCVANASYYQRVTLSWPGDSCLFTGTGEGQPMKTPDGQTSVSIGPTGGGFELTATFEYSTSGPQGPFRLATASKPIVERKGLFTVIQVTSEDSTDNDLNDSYLTIVMVSDSTSVEQAGQVDGDENGMPATPVGADEQAGKLQMHAKTYYDDPALDGHGDEHYVDVPRFSTAMGDVEYRGTSWSKSRGQCWNQQTPFGGYLHVIVQCNRCVHPGMVDAVLTLTCTVSYWGSFPTGYQSVNWGATMAGSRYRVTRVTD